MDTYDNYSRWQNEGPASQPESQTESAPESRQPAAGAGENPETAGASAPQPQSAAAWEAPDPGAYSQVPPHYGAPAWEQPGSSGPEPYRYVPPRSRETWNQEPRNQEPRRQKPSPYADSPYVVNPPRREEFQYQPQTQPAPKKPKAKKKGIWRGLLAGVLTLALVAGSCLITAGTVNHRWEQQNSLTQDTIARMNQRIQEMEQQLQSAGGAAQVPSGSPVASTSGMSPAQVYAQNVSSVVAISVSIPATAYTQGVEGATAGSGFILTEDGYVVTNYHVVEGASAVSVIIHDGTEMAAKLVGYDSANDVAVLKVEATGLPAARLGSSSSLNVGDMVVAIGNPLGELNSTQTVGYICGKDREVTTGGTIINMLQTDAAINPGNSGGPLFNMNGEVVGITTAKYSGTTSSGASIEGIGFAIPIDDIQGIIGDLQTYGYVTGAYLGVVVQNMDAAFSSAYGISGACVVSVEPGYAAARAGIQAKDIIIGVDGHEVGSITDLTRILRGYNAGDTITVTLIRGGLQKQLQVTLDEKPHDLNQEVPPEEGMPSEGNYDEWYEYFHRHFGE